MSDKAEDLVPDGDQELSDEELLEEDLEEEECQDLFSERVFKSSKALVRACKEDHGLDLEKVALKDEYLWIRVINFCRKEFAKRERSVEEIAQSLQSPDVLAAIDADDSLLQPVMQDDALLYAFDDVAALAAAKDNAGSKDASQPEHQQTQGNHAAAGAQAEGENDRSIPAEERIAMLEDEVATCRAKIRELLDEVIELDDKLDSGSDDDDNGDDEEEEDDDLPDLDEGDETLKVDGDERKTKETRNKNKKKSSKKTKRDEPSAAERNAPDSGYFASYGRMGIHEEMLRDRPRTEGYREAVEAVVPGIENATVLDVGCGTGILSMFAARAGAKRVVAVDASSIAELAERLVRKNGFADIIEVVNGRVEELESKVTEDIKADVIVSEWMGYGLLFESMLDSVLDARDRWLKPGGVMIPCKAAIYLQGQSNMAKFDYWRDVYGFDYSELCEMRPRDPAVEVANPATIVTDRALAYDIDIATVRKEDLDFSAEMTLRVSRDATLTSFVISFDCAMAPGTDLVLSTAAEAPQTHWVQTVLYLENFLTVVAGQELLVSLSYKRNDRNKRDIDITLAIDNKHYRAYTLN
ncbi:Protein arginine N-methyltransferase 1 [Hondaea fermentalgiana]|uniref:Protein arginine N-methyltransferase 1 n=1 Tax=Hondaea fermentalgiana TaxID=2315210 RepID=A0A2R5GDZ5_9STRA|nr:Protein arginine N-methyltransferase 1 [Hondaea fermentalgiana]|eukprot:GBG29160.1 Protein arginine N-methyltransferase 1 [Hondaea fermentalgiana]